jgi:hypothetical protein
LYVDEVWIERDKCSEQSDNLNLNQFLSDNWMQVNTSLYITLHLLKLLRLDCATPKAFLIIAKKKIRYINVILPEVANLWQKS